MARTGYIQFFTTRLLGEPVVVLEDVMRLTCASKVVFASRTSKDDDSWAEVQTCLASSDTGPLVVIEEIGAEDMEIVAKDAAIEEVASFYDPRGVFRAFVHHEPLGAQIQRALDRDIPETVRGNFRPWEPIVTVGWHDIYECLEHPNGHLFGRASFSFAISGYRSPNDPRRYRDLVFTVPEIQALESGLKGVVADLQRCVY